MHFLVSSNQTASVKNRFTSESGRVILDILEISNTHALEGFLVKVDIEKAFDSVNHCFLLQIIQKFRCGIDFAIWIKAILKNQESCIINGGKTTKYFKLKGGTQKWDPISVYLFVLERPYIFMAKGFNFYRHEFWYTAYVDDTTFFLKDRKSTTKLMNELNTFSNFSGLKPTKRKCEIAGIAVLSGLYTTQKMKFSIKDFFSKCDQIRSFLRNTWCSFFV